MCGDAVTSIHKSQTVGQERSPHKHTDLVLDLQHLHDNLGGMAGMHASPELQRAGTGESLSFANCQVNERTCRREKDRE